MDGPVVRDGGVLGRAPSEAGTEETKVAYLDVEDPSGARSIALPSGGVCRIGRGADSTVVIADSAVSRRHALIDCQSESSFYVTDLGSMNGTLLNGGRIAGRVRLSNGDRIKIGPATITVRLPAAPRDHTMTSAMGSTRVLRVTQFITVLVADIRGYTGLSLRLGEERLSEVMSAFFQNAGVLLAEHGASAQKYIGDAVMAVWTHGEQQPGAVNLLGVLDSAARLFSAATDLHQRFGLAEPIRIGVGINTGFAAVGNLGSAVAADYTALGDTVNKAFRLETATKMVNTDLLIGWMTYQCLKPALQRAFETFTVELKGYDVPEQVFAITSDSLASLAVA